MAITTYEPTMTMQAARDRYFAVNHFGTDGGYGDAWVDFELGSIPFPFPNTKSRIRAVKVHDLHHIVTGYDTNTTGEFEISAWEIGAGCKDFFAAWQLNLAGMAGGLFSAPVRTFRAFVRGRHSESLYGKNLDELLHLTVADVHRMTSVDAERPAASAADVTLHALGTVAGIVIGTLFLAVAIPLLPLGLVMSYLRKRSLRAEASRVDPQAV